SVDTPVRDWHFDPARLRATFQRPRCQPMKIDTKRLLPVMLLAVLGLAAAVPVLGQQKSPAAAKPAPASQAAPSAALAGTISGKVLERGKDPVPYANVIVLGTKQGTMTDENGSFVIRGVPVGSQLVQASALGFDKVTETVQVNAGATATVTFTVGSKQPVKQLEEIEVKAERRIDT